ncbi:restriction endonuclease subunit S [Halomonas beimenensis]|uniref:Type I restriction-modification system, specificity subunit S n=1 Tax=Halomonas beimenensis TaxID=475662 RepID=A0A291P3R3_9GAMM|nr:restriction endonuclease subunit S [Halomonas beimenensis]ATJ81536.1 type I restriction-modification system, specificity subunit S [Halomonas beimenensis]
MTSTSSSAQLGGMGLYHTLPCPDGWTTRRLRFLTRINKAQPIPLAPEDEVSFVPMAAVGENGGLQLDQVKALDEVGDGYTYFADGDVVTAKITPCFENGKGAFAEGLNNGIAFGTTELHIIRPGEEIDGRFLFYLSISELFRKLGEGAMYGAGGQKRVPELFIKDFQALLPPLGEQQKIATFLDRKTAEIDTLIDKKRRLLDRLAEKRTALITRAVTKGLNPDTPMKDSGIEWLGEIPAHWETGLPIKYLVKMSGGMTPSTSNPLYWDGDIPWVSPKDMKRPELIDAQDHVTELALSETGLSLVETGSVLIVVRGMILAHSFPVAINRVPVVLNQDMKALKVGPRLSPEYFALLLRAIADVMLSLVESSAHGTKALRTDRWKELLIALPPVDEQDTIVELVEKMVADLDSLEDATSNTIDKLEEYRSALITNAVTGQIKVS